MKRTCVILFVFLHLINAGAYGQVDKVLDWDTCVREVLKENPELISARENVSQTRSDKAIVRGGLLPQVSGSASGRQSKKEDEDATDSYSYGLSASQLLFDGGKTRSAVARAEEGITASRLSYEITSSSVRYSLRIAFIGLLRAQELAGITENILKRREQSTRLIELRYEAGREHKGSLLTAQAKQTQAEFEVAEARRNLELAQRELIQELGRTNFVPIQVKGDLKTGKIKGKKPDFDSLAEHTPAVKALVSGNRIARLGVKSARADFLPSVQASASTDTSSSDWPPDEDAWSVGVSMSIPVFESGRRIAEISKAKSEVRRAEADEWSGRISTVATLQSGWTELQDAVEWVEVKRKFLEATGERARISEAQYSSGLLTFDNWIIIEDEFVHAQKSLLDAQASVSRAEANWIYVKGGTLENEME